jgi:hypothetical protein
VTSAKDTNAAVSRLMAGLGLELQALARNADGLQDVMSDLIGSGGSDLRTLAEGQTLDALHQTLVELAHFCSRLSEAAHREGFGLETTYQAASGIRLSRLSRRFLQSGAEPSQLTAGECELW